MKRIVRECEPLDSGVLARRQWLKGSLNAIGALAALRGLSGCSSGSPAHHDSAGTGAGPASPSPSANMNGAMPSGTTMGNGGASAGMTAAGAAGRPAPAGGGPSAAKGSGGSDASTGQSPASSARIACEVVVPMFPSLADGGPGTSFTVMDNSTTADWIVIAGATAQIAAKVPAGILNLLGALDKLYVGYPLSLLQHSLQTASRAMQANASDDLVLCALCHDIGMALSVEGHAEISASILRGYVAEDAYRVVRHHTEFEWQHAGAPAGQPTDQRSRYSAQPWFADAARFIDEWEQASYDPSFTTRPLTDFTDLVNTKFGSAGSVSQATANDCIAPPGGSKP